MSRPTSATPLLRALDEARFGRSRTLDLRRGLPSAADAEARAESWLRERQVSIGGDVLIITGRGRGSEGGVAVVRPAIVKRLGRLRRQGIVAAVQEHTPGSFVVTLAPVRDMLAAAPRRKDGDSRRSKRKGARAGAADLRPATEAALRTLATRSLDLLGVRATDSLIEEEMRHHLARFSAAVGAGADRDVRLKAAIQAALSELSNA
jgi:hypothetical protein